MALGGSQATASTEDARRMGRITRMGVWMSVLPSNGNGTELGVQEWRYSLLLSYGIDPPYLLEHCDGCGAAFGICHALDCKKGGLISARHNDLCDGVADLASKAFTPTHVREDPQIYTGHAVCGRKEKLKG